MCGKTSPLFSSLPEQNVRVIAEDVGGGFGSKSRPYAEEIIVAHASRMLNRPVKWIEDRVENLQATTHSRAMTVELEIGCDEQGASHRTQCRDLGSISAPMFSPAG